MNSDLGGSSDYTGSSQQPATICDDDHPLDSSKNCYNTFKDDGERRSDNHGKDIDNSLDDNEKLYTIQEAVDSMGFGRYQVKISLLLALVNIADAMEVMLISVLSPTLRCVFRLDSFQQSILSMIVFFGILVSASLWGKIGDRYGRKSSVVISTALYAYFGILTAFSPSFLWIVLNRFIVAVGLGGFVQTMTLFSECVPSTKRGHAIILIAIIWATGACLEILLAMFSLSYLTWRWLLFLTACPCLLFISLSKMLPESPRYLLSQGRHEEAVVILKEIARANGKELPKGRLYQPCDKTSQKNRFRDIFTPKLLRTSLLLGLAMSMSYMAYYGTALMTPSLLVLHDGCHGYTSSTPSSSKQSFCWSLCRTLGNNDYMDLFVTSLGDLPGIVVCFTLMLKLGRLVSLAIQMALFTLSMLLCNFCLSRQVLVVLLFCARAMGSGASQGILLYITEVYPTPVRAIGMGWCSSLRCVGVIVAVGLSVMLVDYSAFLGISSFAIIGFIGALAFILLPYETRNRSMPETLDDSST